MDEQFPSTLLPLSPYFSSEYLMIAMCFQWIVKESSAPISHAIFSCDSQLIYASFLDGTVRVFGALNLQLQCQINPTAYVPFDVRYSMILFQSICPFSEIYVLSTLSNQ